MNIRNFILVSLLALSLSAFSQAGAKVYAGLNMGVNRDKVVAPTGTAQSGYLVGLDGRLNSDRMYFLLGVQYGTLDIVSIEKPTFFSGDKLSYYKGRIGLGFDIIRVSKKALITGKLLGSLMFNSKYDRSLLPPAPYNVLNDGTATLIGGLGARLGILSVDFEYDYGLFNQYFGQKKSALDLYSLTVGVSF